MAEQVLEYDIVIVGSGAGGGTVAKELSPLCRDGCRIALLEWGGHFAKKDFTRKELEMASKLYFEGGGFQNDERDLTLAFAKAVGGSTAVYTGTSLKMTERVLRQWNVPGLTLEDLNPRYEKYIRENNVHLYPEDEINDNNRYFMQACRRLNWRAAQFPINTRGCVGLATCNLGCAVHAKQGTAQVQIPMAVQNGVQLIPFCRVDRLEGTDVLATVIPPEHGLQPSTLAVGRYRFKAKKVVLCAGAIWTPVILEKSFGRRWPAIGRYFTCHPAMILAALHEKPLRVTTGHPKSYYCDEFEVSQRFILETCFYYPFTLAKNLVGFGAAVDEVLHRYQNLQLILALSLDEPEEHNRVYLGTDGRPHVSYSMGNRTVRALVEAIKVSARIFFVAGAEKVHAPAMKDRFFIFPHEVAALDELVTAENFKLGKMSIATAHLMGGCRMGTDVRTTVTDAWGRVHGKDGLYVADASLFPAASEINPYLTIMALADRVAEAVMRDVRASQ